MPNNDDDLTHSYQQRIALSNRTMFDLETKVEGSTVHMGTVLGGKPQEGEGTVLKAPEATVPPSTPAAPPAIKPDRMALPPEEEAGFQTWYGETAKQLKLNADPDAPGHKYDYRAFYKSGQQTAPDPTDVDPDTGQPRMHFSSQFKDDDHPNRFVRTEDGKILDSKHDRVVTPQQLEAIASPQQASKVLMAPYEQTIQEEAAKELDPDLLRAVAYQESRGKADAVSPKGATGLMQLMPETAKEAGVTDPKDAEQNIAGGAKQLAKLIKQYDGDTEKALAAYNFGPGNVAKGKPLPKETKNYIKTILSLVTSDETAEAAPPEPGAVGITPRREFTVDTPEMQKVKEDWRQKFAELTSGETPVKELGKVGKQVAEAVRPGFEVAARAVGLDEEAAATVGSAFVEFMGGLPGDEQTDFAAGVETALAAIPAIAGMYKVGKTVGGAAVEGILKNKEAIIQEFQKAASVLKSERGSIPLGPGGTQNFEQAMTRQAAQHDPETLAKFSEALTQAQDFAQGANAQRRYVLGDAQVLEMSKRSSLTVQAIMDLPPGTTLPSEDMVKVYDTLKTSFSAMKDTLKAAKKIGGPNEYRGVFEAMGQTRRVLQVLLGVYAEQGRGTRLMRAGLPGEGGELLSDAERAALHGENEFAVQDPWVQQLIDFFMNAEEEAAKASGQPVSGKLMSQFIDALDALKTPEEMAGFIKSIDKPHFWEAWTEQWYNWLLTGLAPIKNLVGSPAILAAEVANRGISAGINSITTGTVRFAAGEQLERNIYMGEVGSMLYGTLEAFRKGMVFTDAWRGISKLESTAKGGVSSVDVLPPKVSATSQYLHMSGMWGRAVDYLSTIGPRLLMGGDNFNGAIALQAQLHALALRKGYQTVYREGLTGTAAAARLQHIQADVLANAQKYPEVYAEAEEFRAYVTLQRDLETQGQKIQQFFGTFSIGDPERGGINGFPLGRMLQPFVKITTNSTKMAGEWSGPLQIASQTMRDEIAAGGARRDAAMGKVAFSTALIATVWEAAANGLVTGRGPHNPDAQQQWRAATGKKPNAFWDPIAKEYRPLTGFEPFNTVVGTVADFYDILSYAPPSQDLQQRVQYGIEAFVLAVSNNIQAKPFMQGMTSMATGLFSGNMEAMDDYMRRQLPSLITPYSGALRQIKKGVDPTMRQALDFKDALMKDIPGLSDKLKPERDGLGVPILSRNEGYWNPWATGEKSEHAEIWQALNDHNIVLGKVSPVLDGVQLTGAQFDKYEELATEGLAEALEKALVGKDLTDQQADRIVRQHQEIRRRIAAQEMRKGDYFPELADSLEAQQERKKEGDTLKPSKFAPGKVHKSLSGPTIR